ncbi:hypothetical protein ACFWPA_18835 [Rhodococcus sp. NPDC058505]|uniref:hypothetical protein n=1 Tax=unclassified Rhodococcus (in: high G+C Gram-positive bacteria) TaxID=192944 RepID=UPI003658568A
MMVEIGVVFGYVVVIATIALVLFGVVAMFILSIRASPSTQSLPDAAESGARSGRHGRQD